MRWLKKPTREELNRRIKKFERETSDCIRTNEALRKNEKRFTPEGLARKVREVLDPRLLIDD